MGSMKKRARDNAGKFEAGPSSPAKATRRAVGRPRGKKAKEEVALNTFEVSITVSVGGTDVDNGLLASVQSFLVEKTAAGKCSLERGGAAFHLHLQMVARLQARSLIAIPRMLKEYLGWDKEQPIGGMVTCKKLANKGLHTFLGMIGYCMKDASKDHFQTIDHNISAANINIGLEQYALYGQEEKKNRIVLTTQNLVDRVFMWRRFNCKHPSNIDFERDLFDMLKTSKYYPSANWVIGGYGKGYEAYRIQELYKIMVAPHLITREDVTSVFEVQDTQAQNRKQWFSSRWQEDKPGDKHGVCEKCANKEQAKSKQPVKINLEEEQPSNMKTTRQDFIEVEESKLSILCKVALDGEKESTSKRRKYKKDSPTRDLWPEEWHMYSTTSSSFVGASSDALESGHAMFGIRTCNVYISWLEISI